MLCITSVMLSKRITPEVSTRGLIKESVSFSVKDFLQIHSKGSCSMTRTVWWHLKIIFTCEKESSSLQQYSPQSRSYSWPLEYLKEKKKKKTSVGSTWNTKSRRERKHIFSSSRTKTTVQGEGETDGRIKHINGKTRGKRPFFFIILHFFCDFSLCIKRQCIRPPFVQYLLHSSPVSSPPPLLSSPLLCAPPRSLPSSPIQADVSFDPWIPRLTPLSPILPGSY